MTNVEKNILDEANTMVFSYDQWRGKFLRIVLWIMSILGSLLVLANIPAATAVEFTIYVTLLIALFATTLLPIPYMAKAGALIAIGYFIGLFNLIGFGPYQDGTVFFLAITVFSSLLFDERTDWYIFTLNVLSLVTTGILDITGVFTVSPAGFPKIEFGLWLAYTADYIMLALASIWAINLFKNEFKMIAEQFRSALFFVTRDRTELERRVDERTAGLVKKTDQLRAASYIAHQTAELQDMESILNTVVNLITEQFGHYHTGIFLMNETGNEVYLQAASSEGGKQMLEKGHAVKVGATDNIVGVVASQKKPRIALDTGPDPVSFNNNTDLPLTRSQVVIPLITRNKVLGILDIQSDQPQAFKMDDIDVTQTLADQIAVAIENARLLDEAQSALLQIEALTAVRTREAWSQKIKENTYSYTYTPLGMNRGQVSVDSDKALKIPIILRGQKIGSISLVRKDDAPWSSLDEDLVNEVAYQTGLAIDNIRLVEDATQRAKQEQTVGELATRFSQFTDIDILLQTAARELGQVADVAEVSVFVGDIPEQAPQKKRSKRSAG